MKKKYIKKINIGIDASRCKSGGGIAYIIGLLSHAKPNDHGIRLVHLWAYDDLLSKIEEYPWLVKHKLQVSLKNLSFVSPSAPTLIFKNGLKWNPCQFSGK